jgi:hypothetical protein
MEWVKSPNFHKLNTCINNFQLVDNYGDLTHSICKCVWKSQIYYFYRIFCVCIRDFVFEYFPFSLNSANQIKHLLKLRISVYNLNVIFSYSREFKY